MSRIGNKPRETGKQWAKIQDTIGRKSPKGPIDIIGNKGPIDLIGNKGPIDLIGNERQKLDAEELSCNIENRDVVEDLQLNGDSSSEDSIGCMMVTATNTEEACAITDELI